MDCVELLENHEKLNTRKLSSERKIEEIKTQFLNNGKKTSNSNISVFCAGSLGRGDIGLLSDLDLFPISSEKTKNQSRLLELEVLSEIIGINSALGYKSFSNDGQYLKLYSFRDMIESLGAPRDDNENLFTARMLLLLESRPVCNGTIYKRQINAVIKKYFRDSRGRESFKPLFLVNDILRYWRTLCLNYELTRDNSEKPWRKKNINLKFSRMLTVFGTILPIIAHPSSSEEYVRMLSKFRPIKRLAMGLDMLKDKKNNAEFQKALDYYENFLNWKERFGANPEINDENVKSKIKESAKFFSDFLYNSLTHKNINFDFKKYLIL